MIANNTPGFGTLAGVRVVEFGGWIAGPLAAMLLADQGAEVVRVDPPGGPRFRSTANATWNRGKRLVELDLKTPGGQAEALALVAQADVVIENAPPGRMARFGLDGAGLVAGDPRLIHCALPGFAADDSRAGLPAWEGVVGAATDCYRPVAGGEPGRPAYFAVPAASNFAAFHAAAAITAALIARERDGLGQMIEVALHDAMFSAVGARGLQMAAPGDPPVELFGYGHYRCADGHWVHFAPLLPRLMDRFAAAAGIEAWREEGLFDRDRLTHDPALRATLRARLEALFLTRSAAAWQEFGAGAEVALGRCNSMAEWVDTPHARQCGAVTPVPDPVHGTMLQPGIAVRLSHSPGRVRGEPPAAWEPRAAPAGAGGGGGPVLAGVRVLDLTQIWAGPTAGRLLAEYGADVIKINSPHEAVLTHADVNRGKRTVLLDLVDPADMALFRRLAQDADVVLQNFTQGVAERLGCGVAALRALRPDIIYGSVSCYGYDGPWGGRRGFEVQGQAAVGAQVQFGGEDGPRRLPYEINDYGTGILAGWAVLLALLHRRRTGDGQAVEAALAYTATVHQSLWLQGHPGKAWTEPSGPLATGTRPLHRLYEAADGWFFLGAHDGEWPAVMAASGAAEATEAALAACFAAITVAECVGRLAAAGVGAHRLVPVEALMTDARSIRRGFSLVREHEGLGQVRTIGPVPSLSRTGLRAGDPVRPPGADGPAIRVGLWAGRV